MTFFPQDILDCALKVVQIFQNRKWKIVTAESCTGGLISAALTEIPGASNVVDRGFVSYSNESKIDLLGVLPELIHEFGAVSSEVAEAMAQGALEYSQADLAISVTGIAGPGGAVLDKPVGLVYFGLARRNGTVFHYKCQFSGNRADIRQASTHEALKLIISIMQDSAG